MNEKKNIYIISDLHNHYTITVDALKEAGYDENNSNNLLVVLGDILDRGPEALEVFNWLYKLTSEGKAIVLSGNHHPMFISFLEGSTDPFNYFNNGLNETIADFWHRSIPFETWCLLDGKCEQNLQSYCKWCKICSEDINKEYPDLLPWLKSLPDYLETKSFIMTHGTIDGNCPDWHNPPNGWEDCHWAKPRDFMQPFTNIDKTIIVGHIDCGTLREENHLGKPNDYSICKRIDEKIIGLDTCTILTKKINVLVIEDELL